MKPQARGLNFTTRRQNLNPRNNLWGWFLSDISSVLQITLLTVADFLWTYISDRKHRHKLRDNILLVWIFTNFTGIFQGRRLSFRQKSNGHLHRCFRSLPVLWNMLSFHASHISSSRKTSSHISTVEYRQLNLFLLYLNQLQNKLYIFFLVIDFDTWESLWPQLPIWNGAHLMLGALQVKVPWLPCLSGLSRFLRSSCVSPDQFRGPTNLWAGNRNEQIPPSWKKKKPI